MNRKDCSLNHIDELCLLTDMALQAGRVNNLAKVTSCLEKRRAILEKNNIFKRDLDTDSRKKTADEIEHMLQKDCELRSLLEGYKKELLKDIDKYQKMRKLRRKFNSKKSHIPKFIDKKL